MIQQQRKVATLRGGDIPKLEKIEACLASYPEGATPKMIAHDTTLNVNTVKSLLSKSPLIRKKLRGLYIVVNGGDGTFTSDGTLLTDWNFHNCILTTQTETKNTDSLKLNYTLFNLDLKITNHKAVCRFSSDYPLNVTSIEMLSSLFLKELNITEPHPVTVSSIEFNKDYENLRLDGLNAITVDNLTTQFKLYQKSKGLRVEHKTKVPISVESIVDMLTQNPNSLDTHIKLNEANERLERLTRTTEHNTQIVSKLLRKVIPL